MIKSILLLMSFGSLLQASSATLNETAGIKRSLKEKGCQVVGTCSQICQETETEVICSCYDDYMVDPNDNKRCKANRGTPILFYSDSNNVEQVDMTNGVVRNLVYKQNSRIGALDYHYTYRTLYWADLFREGIYRTSLATGETFWAPVVGGRDSEPVSPAGLAVDWVYNRLYWTDLLKGIIQFSNLDGSNKGSLMGGQLHNPADIVVYPPEGWMFWTCRGSRPQVERAGMDGSRRQVLINSDMRLPMGLALDLVQRRLFWADQETQVIGSCDWDGANRKIVLRGSAILPAFLAVFEDSVYWSDWGWKGVMFADKLTGMKQTSLTTYKASLPDQAVSYPYGVRMYHPYMQPTADNMCRHNNGFCSHHCLPAPYITIDAPRTSCWCPDHLALWSNGRTCCRPTGCQKGMFGCVQSGCVKCIQVCNGINDCQDGSDESGCNPGIDPAIIQACPAEVTESPCANHSHAKGCPEDPPAGPCSSKEFKCRSKCIPLTKLCNGVKDCPHGEDEYAQLCSNLTRKINPFISVGVEPIPTTTPATSTAPLLQIEEQQNLDTGRSPKEKNDMASASFLENNKVPLAVGLVFLALAVPTISVILYFVSRRRRQERIRRLAQQSVVRRYRSATWDMWTPSPPSSGSVTSSSVLELVIKPSPTVSSCEYLHNHEDDSTCSSAFH